MVNESLLKLNSLGERVDVGNPDKKQVGIFYDKQNEVRDLKQLVRASHESNDLFRPKTYT